MKIVVSQPMYFPWVGMFEQIRLCDIYVHYDDVQFSKGSFTNRVQIKTSSKEGYKWLTVPVKRFKLGARIKEIEVDYGQEWRSHHLELLREWYKQAPFFGEMISIVEELFANKFDLISDLSANSMEIVMRYFKIHDITKIYKSSQLNIEGSSSQRVFDIVKSLGGTTYITGHGAKNYLNHELFERNGLLVEYMSYMRRPYSQLNGPFNPHVSILDLIANVGKEGIKYIISLTKNWREFLHESH